MSNAQGSHRAARGGFGRRKPDQPGAVPPPRAVLPKVALPKVALPRPTASPEALRRLVPQALVVAFLAGGTSAFLVNDKAVKLTVDGGEPRTLHTFAGEVEELLAHEGVSVGAHDIVAPAPGAELANGDEVVVRYGRPVLLTLDGQRRQVWTTARTVEGALRQLGVRAQGAFLSVSRSATISRSGLALDVRTERTVTFMADGREHTIRTNAATVAEALAQAGLALDGQDTTSVPPDTFPRDGSTISVLRITAGEQVRDKPIPYDTVRTEDPGLFRGTEVVDQQGRPGARRVTYALRTVNGVKEKPRKIHEEVVRRAVTQRVRVGTKTAPASVSGADGLNWAGLAACESGGRPGAVDASGNYGGLYQFDTGTWHALGGSGRPQDAPAEEQTYRAKKLYVQRGASPWPHCGRRLTG
ncbi:resuscitation-promoting factor [Streptomyces scopuliridis]|uniref:Transglycosylase n=1 Tax=Streptomyces scopuliridis RB72 TaxID=1440053 RepID=A0A2T7T6E8_9ACTN|nr:resuscitation-promoting factor [Streptomyces scopuliridis]PVE10727.1 transglycosylase [Streptomyces scopuliridis RB72]